MLDSLRLNGWVSVPHCTLQNVPHVYYILYVIYMYNQKRFCNSTVVLVVV